MTIPPAFRGHGVYIYQAPQCIERFGSAAGAAAALREMDMDHAWVRLHWHSGVHLNPETAALIGALHSAGLQVAGWGWAKGDDPHAEAAVALQALRRYPVDAYVAHIEHGDPATGSHWHAQELRAFFDRIRSALPHLPLAVASYGNIGASDPGMPRTVDPYVDAFAPLMHWYRSPTPKLLRLAQSRFGAIQPAAYPLDDPVSHVRLCLAMWRHLTGKPLLVTAQAHWDLANGFSREIAERKLDRFVAQFDGRDAVIGLNWWHLGGTGFPAMSDTMRQTIAAARLGRRFAAGG